MSRDRFVGRGRLAAPVSRAIAEVLERRQLLSFGDLDPVFSVDGKLTTSTSGNADQAAAALLQPDGKLVVAGTRFIGNLPDFSLARYNADGSLDTTFGGGTGLSSFTFGSDDFCTDAALQADGKIVLVGYTNSGAAGANDTVAVRFNPNGTVDTLFGGLGTGGARIDYFGTDDRAACVAISGTSIFIGGSCFIGSADDFTITKLTSTGALDATLNGSGKLSKTLGAVENATDIAIQGDGKIVLAGFSNHLAADNKMVAFRTTAAGADDLGFDTDGVQEVDFGNDDRAFGVAVDSQNRVVLVGQWDGGASDFAIARLTSTGALDVSFGGGSFAANSGKTNCTFGPGSFGGEERARAVSILPNGSIMVGGFTDAVVAGTSTTPGVYNFAAARFTNTGSLDPTFDGDGRKVIDLGASDQAFGMAVARDASVVLAGGNGADFAIARLRGSLDIRFDTDGKQTLEWGDTDTINAVAVQSDGKIVVAGSWDGGSSDFAIARYNPDGTLDNTFGFGSYGPGSGRSNITFGIGTFGGQEFATDLAIQPDGKIVVVGYTDNVGGVAAVGGADFAVCRLNANGTPDLSFNGTGKFTLNVASTDQASSVVILPNGKILVAGTDFIGASPDFAVLRLNSTGTLDGTFGAGGVRIATFGFNDFCHDMVVQPDGKIVLVGETNANSATTGIDAAAVRLTPDGNYDPTFDGDGFVRLNRTTDDVANAAALGPDGGIYLGGSFDLESGFADFQIVKLTSLGAPDGGFGAGGFAGVLVGGQDVGTSLIRTFDGHLILAGYSSFDSPAAINVFAAARFTSNGTFDPTFQPDVDAFGNGLFRQRFGAASDSRALAAAMQPDGKIILAGTADGDFAIARLSTRASMATTIFLVDQAPPTFTTSRISVQFSDNVLSSVVAADFTLTNTTTATAIPSAQLALTFVPATNTVVIRYTGTANGVLPNGNYNLTLNAGTIQDPAGNSNPAVQTYQFFVLAGDADRDRDVDVNDLGILASNWQLSPRLFSQADFDYSGTVDVNDLGILASHWQQVLAGAPSLAPAFRAPTGKSRLIETIGLS